MTELVAPPEEDFCQMIFLLFSASDCALKPFATPAVPPVAEFPPVEDVPRLVAAEEGFCQMIWFLLPAPV